MAFWSSKDASPARKYRFRMGPAGTNWWYVNSVTLPSFEINVGEYQLLNQKFKYPGVPTWNPVTINIVDTADSVDQIKKFLVSKDFSFLQIEGLEKKMPNQVRQTIEGTAKAGISEAEGRLSLQSTEKPSKELDDLGGGSLAATIQAVNKKRQQRQTQDVRAAFSKAQKGISASDDLDIIIEQLNGEGKPLRTWTLVNSFITSVNYGDLDYSSDELVSIEISVAYDYATTEK
jgi:hypothetical protein